MIAVSLYRAFLDRGITMRVDGEDIVVAPSTALTDVDRVAIRQHKPDLLQLADDAWPRCADCGDYAPRDGCHWCEQCRSLGDIPQKLRDSALRDSSWGMSLDVTEAA